MRASPAFLYSGRQSLAASAARGQPSILAISDNPTYRERSPSRFAVRCSASRSSPQQRISSNPSAPVFLIVPSIHFSRADSRNRKSRPSRTALSAMPHTSTRFFVEGSSGTPPPKAVPFSLPCFLWRGCTPDHPVPIRFRMKLHPSEAIGKVPLTSDLRRMKSFLLVLNHPESFCLSVRRLRRFSVSEVYSACLG